MFFWCVFFGSVVILRAALMTAGDLFLVSITADTGTDPLSTGMYLPSSAQLLSYLPSNNLQDLNILYLRDRLQN